MPTTVRGVGGGLELPVRGHGDAVGVAEHRPERRCRLDDVATLAQHRRPRGWGVVLDDHGGRHLAVPRVEPGRPRRAAPPAARPRPRRRRRLVVQETGGELGDDRGWASPPVGRARRRAAPSRVASAGTSVCGGRRPGVSSAGCPGAREKPSPRLCRLMPVVGSTSHEPKPEAFDWIRLTAQPAVVGRAQVRRVAGVGCRRSAAARSGSIVPARRDGASEQSGAVGAVVEHVRAIERGGLHGLDEQVGPLDVVRRAGQPDPLRRARRWPSAR